MNTPRKTPRRRVAYLQFPAEVFHESAIDRIAAEGYDEVGLGVITSDEGGLGKAINQGFAVTQAEQIHGWCHVRGLSVMVFTGYMKYEEPLLAREPRRAMVTYGGDGERLDSDGVRSNWLCPFQSENIERYWIQILEPVTRWPALREIHLNDEAFLGFGNGAIGCYCDYCTAQYLKKCGAPPPSSCPPAASNCCGVWSSG